MLERPSFTCYKPYMRKVLVLAVLFAFFVGMAVEAKEGPCADSDCCACLCQAPGVQTVKVSVQQSIAPKAERHVVADTRFAQQLFDKSLFHPPKILA